MKRTMLAVLAVVGVGALCGVAIHAKRDAAQSAIEPESDSATTPAAILGGGPGQPETPLVAKHRPTSDPSVTPKAHSPRRESTPVSNVAPSASMSSASVSPITFNQAIENIASPQATHEQKEAAWKHLRDSGRLDQAITELEQRATKHPEVASYPAALGQAYLQKCGTIQDVREQGILAMKADQVFDAALSLDSNNWEARYTKALAMSYWPTQMNRGSEVMQHFVTLVERQETQSPQPHFAQTYTRLGDEYLKYGHRDYAQEVWQRGVKLFPENQELRARLSGR